MLERRFFPAVLALVIFLAAFWSVYSVHFSYPFPLHSDEWDHLAIASEMSAKESLINYDPFTLDLKPDTHWEIAYHIFLLSLLKLTGLSAVQLGTTLPLLVAMLLAFATFVLVDFIFKDKIMALIACLFVFFIKSNITLLGLWFTAPVMLGMAFIPAILILFFKSISSWRYALLFLFAFLFSTLSHPPSTIIFLPCFALFFILNPRLLWQAKEKIALGLIGCYFIVSWMLNRGPIDMLALLPDTWMRLTEALTFTDRYVFKAFFDFPSYLGYSIFFLLLGGLAFIAYSKGTKRLIFILFPLSVLPFIIQFYWMNWNYLAPYRRMFLDMTYMFLVIAGIALGAFASFVLKAIRQGRDEKINLLGRALEAKKLGKGILVVLLVLFFAWHMATAPFSYSSELYHNIEEKNLSSLAWLKQNSQEDDVVLALPWVSKAVFVISERKVIGTNQTRLGSPLETVMQQEDFFSKPCPEKQKIVDGFKFKPSLAYSPHSLDCSFLEELYSDEGGFVYAIK